MDFAENDGFRTENDGFHTDRYDAAKQRIQAGGVQGAIFDRFSSDVRVTFELFDRFSTDFE